MWLKQQQRERKLVKVNTFAQKKRDTIDNKKTQLVVAQEQKGSVGVLNHVQTITIFSCRRKFRFQLCVGPIATRFPSDRRGTILASPSEPTCLDS